MHSNSCVCWLIDGCVDQGVFKQRGRSSSGWSAVHQEVSGAASEDEEGGCRAAEQTEASTSESTGDGAAGGLHASNAGTMIFDDFSAIEHSRAVQ